MAKSSDLSILHLADVHIGAKCVFLGDKSAQRSHDFLRAFERATDHALDGRNRIDLVCVAGDLFGTLKPSQDAIARVAERFKRLEQQGIPAVLVPGSTDSLSYPDSVYRTERFPWVHILKGPAVGSPWTRRIRAVDVSLYGMAYHESSVPPFDEFRAVESPGIHVALLHGTLVDDRKEIPARHVPLRPDRLAKTGMHYIALGRVHNFHEVEHGGVRMVYPGTLEGKGFDETGDRYLVTARFAGGAVEVEKTAFQRRTIRDMVVDTAAVPLFSDEDVIAHVRKLARPEDIMKIRIRGTAEFVPTPAAIEAGLEAEVFHAQVTDETVISSSRALQSLAREKTVRGIFARRMQEGIAASDPTSERPVLERALKVALRGLFFGEEGGAVSADRA